MTRDIDTVYNRLLHIQKIAKDMVEDSFDKAKAFRIMNDNLSALIEDMKYVEEDSELFDDSYDLYDDDEDIVDNTQEEEDLGYETVNEKIKLDDLVGDDEDWL